MSNRCRSLALVLIHPLFLSITSSLAFFFPFLSFTLFYLPRCFTFSHLFCLLLTFLIFIPHSLPLCLPLATHSCPVQGAGEHSLEWRCTCSFPLLNSMHQSRRCLSTSGGRHLNALHMQPESIYQQTGNVNVGRQPGFMHLQSTLSF